MNSRYIDELVHLVNKLMLKVNAIFKGNLVPRRSPDKYLKGLPVYLP